MEWNVYCYKVYKTFITEKSISISKMLKLLQRNGNKNSWLLTYSVKPKGSFILSLPSERKISKVVIHYKWRFSFKIITYIQINLLHRIPFSYKHRNINPIPKTLSFTMLSEPVCLPKNKLGSLWYLVAASLPSLGKLINNPQFKFNIQTIKFLKIRSRRYS